MTENSYQTKFQLIGEYNKFGDKGRFIHKIDPASKKRRAPLTSTDKKRLRRLIETRSPERILLTAVKLHTVKLDP